MSHLLRFTTDLHATNTTLEFLLPLTQVYSEESVFVFSAKKKPSRGLQASFGKGEEEEDDDQF